MQRYINSGSLADVRDRGQDFARGDVVFRVNPITTAPIPLPGLVTAVLRGIGVVVVEFPWGSERLQFDEVVRCSPSRLDTLPPSKDTSDSTYDITKSRIEDGTLVGGLSGRVASRCAAAEFELRVFAAREMFHLKSAAEATVDLLHTHGAAHSKSAIHEAVRHVFTRLPKFGLYWSAPGRKYRPSQAELDSGSYVCPRCKAPMSQMHYKLRTRLYGCPACLFLIDPSDFWLPGSDGPSDAVVVEEVAQPGIVPVIATRWNDDAQVVYEDCFEKGEQAELDFDSMRSELVDTAEDRAEVQFTKLSDPNVRNLDVHRPDDAGLYFSGESTIPFLPPDRWADKEYVDEGAPGGVGGGIGNGGGGGGPARMGSNARSHNVNEKCQITKRG